MKWIRAGRSIANKMVYVPLRPQLETSAVVRINKKYTRRAHAVGLKNGALAARRTALWLQDALLPARGEPVTAAP